MINEETHPRGDDGKLDLDADAYSVLSAVRRFMSTVDDPHDYLLGRVVWNEIKDQFPQKTVDEWKDLFNIALSKMTPEEQAKARMG